MLSVVVGAQKKRGCNRRMPIVASAGYFAAVADHTSPVMCVTHRLWQATAWCRAACFQKFDDWTTRLATVLRQLQQPSW